MLTRWNISTLAFQRRRVFRIFGILLHKRRHTQNRRCLGQRKICREGVGILRNGMGSAREELESWNVQSGRKSTQESVLQIGMGFSKKSLSFFSPTHKILTGL